MYICVYVYFFYLFEMKRDWSSIYSFTPQMAVIAKAGPDTWVILHRFHRHISREPDWKEQPGLKQVLQYGMPTLKAMA